MPQGTPLVSSSPIIRLKAKQAPDGEVESEVHKDVCYTTKERNEFANLLKQKSGESLWKWVSRLWDNGEGTQNWIRQSLLVWALGVQSLDLIRKLAQLK